jgi:hypothetical protein
MFSRQGLFWRRTRVWRAIGLRSAKFVRKGAHQGMVVSAFACQQAALAPPPRLLAYYCVLRAFAL